MYASFAGAKTGVAAALTTKGEKSLRIA